MTAPLANTWQPLDSLKNIFDANIDALRSRDAELADRLRVLRPAPRFLRDAGGALEIAVQHGPAMQVLPNPVAPVRAKEVAAKLCEGGVYTVPVLVAGIDQGWLWSELYAAPAKVALLPGYKAPIYLIADDLERLWTAMHLHDWRAMLADTRALIFAGLDAVAQLRAALISNPLLSMPRLSVTLEQDIWREDASLDDLIASVQEDLATRFQSNRQRSDADAAAASGTDLAGRFRDGSPLRVLGVTSRFTTFLQYSMRDWLDSFERMGHTTKLIIETADHETLNKFAYAAEAAAFKPDLIVLIDHYRSRLNAFPNDIPCVMWVQDQLPHVFAKTAGQAQSQRDYAMGFGKLVLTSEFDYPADRYMFATVGVNEDRFTPLAVPPAERSYARDLAFVSHASVPADTIIAGELKKCNAFTGRLISNVYERLKSVYSGGRVVSHPQTVRRVIDEVCVDIRAVLPPAQMQPMINLFVQRVNNALFRHESLHWLAEMDADLHLFGKGWEQHPTLKRFARGVADNQGALSEIYRSSRINLQITPHGVLHQRLFEGLATGAFFLLRHQPGEYVERCYRQLAPWVTSNDIRTDDELRARATPAIGAMIDELASTWDVNLFALDHPFVDEIRYSDEIGYLRCAASVFGDDYDAVAYADRATLESHVQRYLANPDTRHETASRMRSAVLNHFTYQATTQRLLQFIASDLGTTATKSQRIAA